MSPYAAHPGPRSVRCPPFDRRLRPSFETRPQWVFSHGGATSVVWNIHVGDATSVQGIASEALPVDTGFTIYTSGDFVVPNGIVIRPGKSLCTSTGQTGGTPGTILATAYGYFTKDR